MESQNEKNDMVKCRTDRSNGAVKANEPRDIRQSTDQKRNESIFENAKSNAEEICLTAHLKHRYMNCICTSYHWFYF